MFSEEGTRLQLGLRPVPSASVNVAVASVRLSSGCKKGIQYRSSEHRDDLGGEGGHGVHVVAISRVCGSSAG
jgi:hypothetical protein